MRHETVWVDRTIDRNSIKTGRVGKSSSSNSGSNLNVLYQSSNSPPPCRSFNTRHGFLIKHSKEYYYRTLVIANIDNNVALTWCCESCEVWPLKIKLTLLRV